MLQIIYLNKINLVILRYGGLKIYQKQFLSLHISVIWGA